MRLVLDMNLSPAWRPVLEARGHSVRHWSEIGDPGATDEVVLTWAKEHGHVLVTHDLDFGAILAATRFHGPSVVQPRAQDIVPGPMESVLVQALAEWQEALLAGALLVVDPARARARLLPLAPAPNHPDDGSQGT